MCQSFWDYCFTTRSNFSDSKPWSRGIIFIVSLVHFNWLSSTTSISNLESEYLKLRWNDWLSVASLDHCKTILNRIELLLDKGWTNIQVLHCAIVFMFANKNILNTKNENRKRIFIPFSRWSQTNMLLLQEW